MAAQQDLNQWFMVDLGEPYKFRKVSISDVSYIYIFTETADLKPAFECVHVSWLDGSCLFRLDECGLDFDYYLLKEHFFHQMIITLAYIIRMSI